MADVDHNLLGVPGAGCANIGPYDHKTLTFGFFH